MENVDTTLKKGYIMDREKKYIELRCKGDRKHKIGGVEYSCCGSLLLNNEVEGNDDIDIQIRCRICKRLWNITNIDGELSVEEVDRENDLKFKRRGNK